MADDAPILTAVPLIRVVPAEGPAYDVQALNPDMVAYDMTANRHKWPTGTKAPMLWLNFLAWHASRRTGVIEPAVTFEAFRDTTLEVTTAGEGAAVPPTREDPGTDF